MPIQVIKPEANSHLKMLVFGPSKRGKTTLCGTAQEDDRTAPALLLNFDGNTECLVGLDIDVVNLFSWLDFTELYPMLKAKDHSLIPGSSLPPGGRYKTLCVDSVTEINHYALSAEILRQGTGGKGREPGPLGPDQAQLQDFGRVLTQMRRILRMFRDLSMHIIYTALDDSEDEPGVGTVKIPAMIGQMKGEVGALLSLSGYLSIKPGTQERVLLLHDIDRFRIGVREEWRKWGTIPTTMEDPTVGKLMDVVFPRLKVVADQEETA